MTALEKAATAADDCLSGASFTMKDLVRAVLMAVREPTAEMLQPACAKHTPGEPMSESTPHECPGFINRRKRWKSMIDAILNEDVE